uniref:Proteoglycan 4-like isoform X2 n=1 Tax=Crassostrea virginica TaxID=6565 RepID=A0A8B8BNR5_CRAVI|nr:proteoglycan 4-like isoform X2 [Crassostrea virginica]
MYCNICKRNDFKNEHGLNIHKAKAHGIRKQHESAHPPRERHTTATTRSDETKTASRPTASHEGKTHTTNPRGQVHSHTSNDVVRQSAMIVQMEAIQKCPLLGNHFKGPADVYPQRTKTPSGARKPETPKKPHSATKDGHRTKTPGTPHSADTRTPSSTGTDFGGVRPKTPRGARKPDTPKKPHSATKDDHRTKTPGTPHSADTRTPSSTGTDFGGVRPKTPRGARKPETPKKPHSATKDGHRTKKPWTPHSADTRTPSSTDFFICPICDGKSFKYEGWYIKHMENKHPGCAFGVVAKGREDDKSDQEKRDSWKRREDSVDDRPSSVVSSQENHHTSNDIVRQSAMIVQNEAILKSPLLGNHFKGPADIHPQRTQTSSVASKPETPKKPHSTTKDGHRTKTPWTPHSADTRTPSSTGTDFGGVRPKTPRGARKPGTPKKPHSATKDGHRTKTPGTPHSADTRTLNPTGMDFAGVRPKTPRGARKPDTPKKPHSTTKDGHRTKTPGTLHSADTMTPSSTGTDFEGVRPKTSSGARKQETPKKSHSTTKDGHRTKTPGKPHSADTGTPSSTGTDFEGVRPKTSSGARKQETPKKSHSTTKDGHRTKTPGTPHSADTGTPSSTGTDFGGVRPKTPRGARKPETPKKPHSATKDGHRTKTPGTPHSADTRTPSSTDSFICPICDGKSFKYEGWYIKHMENKHPGCAFGVVAKGREDDKSDQEKRDSWKKREDSIDDRPSSVVSNFADSFNIKTFEKWVTVAEASIIRQKTDTDETTGCMNRFIENLESTMDGISHFPLKTFKSGSYYDRTKIDYNDEFDFMFFPDIKMEAVFTNCPPGYCKIRKGVTISKDLDPYLNKDGFLVPGLFKQAMFDLFEKSLSDGTFREGRRATRQTSKPGSPAYTISYNLGIHDKPPIDVDLVPAIRIECWPKPAKEIKPDWVKKETTERATRCFHAVMKTYPENWPDGDLLWRISFTHAEKELILHANEKEKGCRKDIFRLLKKIKEVMKSRNSNESIDKFCSYHLKMFMLKFFDKQKYFGNEMKVDLLKKAIKKFGESVEHGIIPNYFIPEDNVIVNVPEKERTLIAKELRGLLEGNW